MCMFCGLQLFQCQVVVYLPTTVVDVNSLDLILNERQLLCMKLFSVADVTTQCMYRPSFCKACCNSAVTFDFRELIIL